MPIMQKKWSLQCRLFKFKVWMSSKEKQESISLIHVYFESHLVDVPLNAWWIDIGASIHVTTLL